MTRQDPKNFEWQVLDEDGTRIDDITWEQDIDHRPPSRFSFSPTLWRRLVRTTLTLLLVGSFVGGAWLWWRLQQIQQLATRDVQQTISMEALAWQSGDREAFQAILDDSASLSWQNRERDRFRWFHRWLPPTAFDITPRVEQLLLFNQGAEAEIFYQAGASGPLFRETAFFRQRESDGKWLRTAPDPSRWGLQQELSTAYFTFVYHTRDAEAVTAFAQEADQFYLQLYADLGVMELTDGDAPLTSTLGLDRITIVVLPKTDLLSWRIVKNRLEIPSPELMRTRADAPLSQELKRLVAGPLTDRVLAVQAFRGRAWPLVADFLHGISHWEGEGGGGAPSWRWYTEAQVLQEAHRNGIDLQPTALDGMDSNEQRLAHARDMFLVDYIATRYGRHRLAPLLQAFQQYRTWQESVPAALNVSYESFVVGWEDYLTAIEQTFLHQEHTQEQIDGAPAQR